MKVKIFITLNKLLTLELHRVERVVKVQKEVKMKKNKELLKHIIRLINILDCLLKLLILQEIILKNLQDTGSLKGK